MLILVGSLAAVVAGLLFARAQPAQYQTNARFVIAPAPEIQDGNDIVQTIDALANRRAIVSTFGQVVLSERSFDQAVKGAGLTPAQAERTKVSAVVLPEANVVEVFVLGPRQDLTERMLLILGNESTTYFENLYRVYTIQTLDIARLKTEQVAPKPVQSGLIAGVLGMSLALLVGLAGDRLRANRSAVPEGVSPPTSPGSAQPEVEHTTGPTDPTAGPLALVQEHTGSPARGPSLLSREVLPGARDDPQHRRALAVRPGLDLYANDRGPSPHDIIDDPDWWLSELHELGREVRGWSHGLSVARREVDYSRRWRSELDELGRLLGGWADNGWNAGDEDERPDPPKPV